MQAAAGSVASGQQCKNGPGGLRRRAGRGYETFLLIAFAALAPAAVEILDRPHPFQSPLHVGLTVAHAGRGQATQSEERAINVVDTPAPVPASIFFLRTNQVLHAPLNGGMRAIVSVSAQRFEHAPA